MAKKRQFTAEDTQKMAKLYGQGLTMDEVASHFGLRVRQFQRYIADNNDMRDALLKGKAKAIEIISGKLFEKAEAGDNTCLIFWLKTQAKWKDTHSVEFEDKTPTKDLTDDEKANLAKQALIARSLKP